MKKFIWAGAISVFVLIIFGIVFWSEGNKQQRGGMDVSIMGKEHIAVGVPHPVYNSNPPTSGWHYGSAADWKVYDQELPDEMLIHNLEHGGIWISYKDIDEETVNKLKAIWRQYSGSVVITPRQANDTKIALASWGRLDKLDSFDEARILNFILTNKNKSPERLVH